MEKVVKRGFERRSNEPIKTGAEKHVPDADIVHDRFHIEKYLNEAVDKVRKREHKRLKLNIDQSALDRECKKVY